MGGRERGEEEGEVSFIQSVLSTMCVPSSPFLLAVFWLRRPDLEATPLDPLLLRVFLRLPEVAVVLASSLLGDSQCDLYRVSGTSAGTTLCMCMSVRCIL